MYGLKYIICSQQLLVFTTECILLADSFICSYSMYDCGIVAVHIYSCEIIVSSFFCWF